MNYGAISFPRNGRPNQVDLSLIDHCELSLQAEMGKTTQYSMDQLINKPIYHGPLAIVQFRISLIRYPNIIFVA